MRAPYAIHTHYELFYHSFLARLLNRINSTLNFLMQKKWFLLDTINNQS